MPLSCKFHMHIPLPWCECMSPLETREVGESRKMGWVVAANGEETLIRRETESGGGPKGLNGDSLPDHKNHRCHHHLPLSCLTSQHPSCLCPERRNTSVINSVVSSPKPMRIRIVGEDEEAVCLGSTKGSRRAARRCQCLSSAPLHAASAAARRPAPAS